jgi:hypothetical protein
MSESSGEELGSARVELSRELSTERPNETRASSSSGVSSRDGGRALGKSNSRSLSRAERRASLQGTAGSTSPGATAISLARLVDDAQVRLDGAAEWLHGMAEQGAWWKHTACSKESRVLACCVETREMKPGAWWQGQ